MKATSVLNLKSWLQKIHPPLPRSARESQQLLSVLTSSFQRQLDEAHPPIEKRHRATSRTPATTPASQATIRQIDTLIASVEGNVSTLPKTIGNSADLSSSIAKGAYNIESLLRYINARLKESQGAEKMNGSSNDVARTLSVWFSNAKPSALVSVLGSTAILKAMRGMLPLSDFANVMWDEVERFVLRSPGFVTHEEAEAISTSSTFIITSTPRSSMAASADRFSKIISIFREHGYQIRMPEEGLASQIPIAYHPLTQPASRLSQFILLHPSGNNLSAEHFDTLLSNSELWEETTVLRSAFVKAFHPTKPDCRQLLTSLRDPNVRLAYSARLKEIQSAHPQRSSIGPLRHTVHVLREMGRYKDADFVEAFLSAHNNRSDVSKLVIHKTEREDRERIFQTLGLHESALT